jgi:phosphatidylserine/phosphatidylglycerophosphate/cardiolipin synthase-like enzyme
MRLVSSIVIATGVAWFAYSHGHRSLPLRTGASSPDSAMSSEGYYFSPDENLEQLDRDHLRRAEHSVDAAMYAFTDLSLAAVLRELSDRGVTVRLYRDRSQYEAEELKSWGFGRPSSSRLLLGARNVHIRVKQGSERDLMHLKAVCIDGKMLRDGSANWSASGEKSHDNNARFTSNPREIQRFQQVFEDMWRRSGNLIVQ